MSECAGLFITRFDNRNSLLWVCEAGEHIAFGQSIGGPIGSIFEAAFTVDHDARLLEIMFDVVLLDGFLEDLIQRPMHDPGLPSWLVAHARKEIRDSRPDLLGKPRNR